MVFIGISKGLTLLNHKVKKQGGEVRSRKTEIRVHRSPVVLLFDFLQQTTESQNDFYIEGFGSSMERTLGWSSWKDKLGMSCHGSNRR